MKISYAHLAMGLVITLAILLCNVEQTIAQDHSKDAVNGTLSNLERLKMWRDIFVGKIDKPPGAKDWVQPENYQLLPKDLPPTIDIVGTAAGYQVSNTSGGVSSGCVCAYTYSIDDLEPDVEYQVMHQWPTSGENAIAVWYKPDHQYTADFLIYISALGGYQYSDRLYGSATHTYTFAIQPLYSTGSTSYTQVKFYIYDENNSTQWDKTYSLGTTQYIKDVDYALEQGEDTEPNDQWCAFHAFAALDQNMNSVNLQSHFEWKEWQSQNMINVHDEDYFDNGYTASFSQKKSAP